MAVTVKGLMELLASESLRWDQVNSCNTVTPEGLEQVLGHPGVERDPYYLNERLRHLAPGRGRGGPYGTGGDHVGRNLKGKEHPDTLDKEGPDPMHERDFVADEFQGMLMFGPDGKPAFHSLWPEGTKPEGFKELNINIATKIPAYAKDPNGTVKPMLDSRKDSAFGGQTFEEAFEPVDARIVAQIQKYADNFEKTFGIKLNVKFDEAGPDTHISVMGFRRGSASLNGFASFPKAMQGWDRLEKYGHTPGFMCLNLDNTDRYSDKLIHDLFAHEFGHAIGWAHPHDLAIFKNLTQKEAMEMTTMSYTDLKYTPFAGQDGAELGPMDYGLRKWVANAPELHQGNQVYDLDAQHKITLADNQDTALFRRKGILPAIPIPAHGEGNELRGTKGNDFIDTNPGYVTNITHPGTNQAQKFVLVEGHLERVFGIAGDNKIIAAQNGDQSIHPGTGNSEVQFLYGDMKGEKTIHSEGKDTLVIADSLIRDSKTITTRKDGDDLVLNINDGEAKIRLAGQAVCRGVSTFRVVDENGEVVIEQDVKHLNDPREFEKATTWLATAEIYLRDREKTGTLWSKSVQASRANTGLEQAR